MNCDFSFESQGQIQNSPLPQPLPYMSLRLNKWFFYILFQQLICDPHQTVFSGNKPLLLKSTSTNPRSATKHWTEKQVYPCQKIAIFFFINNMFICCTQQHIYCKLTFHRDSIYVHNHHIRGWRLVQGFRYDYPYRNVPVSAKCRHALSLKFEGTYNITQYQEKKITNSKFSGISFAIFFHDLLSIHTEPV